MKHLLAIDIILIPDLSLITLMKLFMLILLNHVNAGIVLRMHFRRIVNVGPKRKVS